MLRPIYSEEEKSFINGTRGLNETVFPTKNNVAMMLKNISQYVWRKILQMSGRSIADLRVQLTHCIAT